MNINVGSTNRIKIQAVKEIARRYSFLAKAKIVSLAVSSGVSEQPSSLNETIRGAINRAKKSFVNCYLSVGLESGLFKVPYTNSGYMDIGICALYDGRQIYLGGSCLFEYPPKVTSLAVKKNMDIDQAIYHYKISPHQRLGRVAGGMIGLLTKNRITRKEYTKQSIITALIQLENKKLYS